MKPKVPTYFQFLFWRPLHCNGGVSILKTPLAGLKTEHTDYSGANQPKQQCAAFVGESFEGNVCLFLTLKPSLNSKFKVSNYNLHPMSFWLKSNFCYFYLRSLGVSSNDSYLESIGGDCPTKANKGHVENLTECWPCKQPKSFYLNASTLNECCVLTFN